MEMILFMLLRGAWEVGEEGRRQRHLEKSWACTQLPDTLSTNACSNYPALYQGSRVANMKRRNEWEEKAQMHTAERLICEGGRNTHKKDYFSALLFFFNLTSFFFFFEKQRSLKLETASRSSTGDSNTMKTLTKLAIAKSGKDSSGGRVHRGHRVGAKEIDFGWVCEFRENSRNKWPQFESQRFWISTRK